MQKQEFKLFQECVQRCPVCNNGSIGFKTSCDWCEDTGKVTVRNLIAPYHEPKTYKVKLKRKGKSK